MDSKTTIHVVVEWNDHETGEDKRKLVTWGKDDGLSEVAFRSASLAGEHQLDTKDIIEKFPWLLRSGNPITTWAVYRPGLVVSVYSCTHKKMNGLAESIVDALRTACRSRMHTPGVIKDGKVNIPVPPISFGI